MPNNNNNTNNSNITSNSNIPSNSNITNNITNNENNYNIANKRSILTARHAVCWNWEQRGLLTSLKKNVEFMYSVEQYGSLNICTVRRSSAWLRGCTLHSVIAVDDTARWWSDFFHATNIVLKCRQCVWQPRLPPTPYTHPLTPPLFDMHSSTSFLAALKTRPFGFFARRMPFELQWFITANARRCVYM